MDIIPVYRPAQQYRPANFDRNFDRSCLSLVIPAGGAA